MADGEEKAFEALFDIYVPRIYPVIEQIVHSESVVDVIQDVFLRLWIARGTLRDIQSPKDYILRMVVYNQSFKHTRMEDIGITNSFGPGRNTGS